MKRTKKKLVKARKKNPIAEQNIVKKFRGDAKLPKNLITRKGVKVGEILALDYRAKHKGKVGEFHHEFKPGSEPNLIIENKGKKLNLTKGRFIFRADGINDL